MTANIAFALCAAVFSLAIVVLAGLKGDWAVVAVYALLVAGFLARASFGRRARAEEAVARDALARDALAAERTGPAHEPERRLRKARFRRR